jgi:hypothetical protein
LKNFKSLVKETLVWKRDSGSGESGLKKLVKNFHSLFRRKVLYPNAGSLAASDVGSTRVTRVAPQFTNRLA